MCGSAATAPLSNGKGFLVVNADAIIDNLAFEGAQVADQNGAGIRYQAGNLVVRNSMFIGSTTRRATFPRSIMRRCGTWSLRGASLSRWRWTRAPNSAC